MKEPKKYNLEDRLVDFAVMILTLSEKLPKTYAGIHLTKQIVRSGTAPALIYGEAQSAESRADFVHKMKIGLKELRETFVCLKIIYKKKYLSAKEIKAAVDENDELIKIFVKSIDTAKKNIEKERKINSYSLFSIRCSLLDIQCSVFAIGYLRFDIHLYFTRRHPKPFFKASRKILFIAKSYQRSHFSYIAFLVSEQFDGTV